MTKRYVRVLAFRRNQRRSKPQVIKKKRKPRRKRVVVRSVV